MTIFRYEILRKVFNIYMEQLCFCTVLHFLSVQRLIAVTSSLLLFIQ
jgi:hypothetical protein